MKNLVSYSKLFFKFRHIGNFSSVDLFKQFSSFFAMSFLLFLCLDYILSSFFFENFLDKQFYLKIKKFSTTWSYEPDLCLLTIYAFTRGSRFRTKLTSALTSSFRCFRPASLNFLLSFSINRCTRRGTSFNISTVYLSSHEYGRKVQYACLENKRQKKKHCFKHFSSRN